MKKSYKYKIIDNQAIGNYGFSWEVYSTAGQGSWTLEGTESGIALKHFAIAEAKGLILHLIEQEGWQEISIKF